MFAGALLIISFQKLIKLFKIRHPLSHVSPKLAAKKAKETQKTEAMKPYDI